MIVSIFILISALYIVRPMPLEQNPKLFEGDILFLENNQRALAYLGSNKWPNGILPWKVNTGVFTESELKTITDALSDLQTKVNADGKKHIEIVPWTNQANWVQIIKDNGCYSYVGLINTGAQSLSLGSGCVYTGIIQHETLHALGFYHEQSRPDRDDYVTINLNNVISGMEHNFNKYTTNIDVYGLPYDYSSIMHYGSYYFSKNNEPTIVPKNQSVTIGNRESMTDIDIKGVRLHYPTDELIVQSTKITSTSSTTTTSTISTTKKNTKKRQKSIIKGSLKITVDLNKFENDANFKSNLTNVLKSKTIENLMKVFSDFADVLEFTLTKSLSRKRQISTTVVDQYTLVLNTDVQRDVKSDIQAASSLTASALSGSLSIISNSDFSIATFMESNKASRLALSNTFILTLLASLYFFF